MRKKTDLDTIKKYTIRALMSDEQLMYGLVLKGGNALQLAYNITDRASIDIDFSIEGDFKKEDIPILERIINGVLIKEFEQIDLIPYDIKFIEKPKENIVKEWKGYNLEFKLVHFEDFDKDNMQKTRNLSIKINGQSPKFTVDISSYEYVEKSSKIDIEGVILRVYTPEMIILEKLRALCQSLPEYKSIVQSANTKGRARDLYDIWNITQNFNFDPSAADNIALFKNIFDAKRVPYDFIELLKNQENENLQKENWMSVLDTITNSSENIQEFEFYYRYTIEITEKILKNL
ncbi:nucleotidyl transferase AbiEii/AbiGii toxin family protein [Myroides odoratimimus]|uniref:nucleotidyl transferase AbiEii/AbiGii toxin family protein n=1 Tax=Myroides odoratimimus TaxID=76832 RepID=UPI002577ADE7|nr:nucleotidyl transferase AbiEii/AbiGii toxin family protein [Myroides odoratimimus]MDM1471995.1 nucleotidyl transferase AbiEii/AbiGii toxin family protein [Myroides odoratimimus]MDM1482002.1 nucleotidyl transferase AbiEii/AbiGii toxin family protein [Myroides odoratimimus]